MRTDPRPCSAAEAVQRARSLIGKGGQYILGTGDYRPHVVGGTLIDLPWTERDGLVGSDCAGYAISWCYMLQRHRPGFNVGSWASVANDINCNSAIEDGQHNRDLFEVIDTPELGALLLYPTFVIVGMDGKPHRFIGHVGIVVGVSRCLEWDPALRTYAALDVAHCHGPNERKPAVTLGDGALWDHHDHIWPKPQHRTVMLRARA
jgi:hypothetical protein